MFKGWAHGADTIYDTSHVEAELEASAPASLSWSKDGSRLAAVGACITVWDVDERDSSIDDASPTYTVAFHLSSLDVPAPFAMGAISPCGSLVAASALYSRVGWVWAVPSHPAPGVTATSYAEIVHGYSGVASMDWKPRGGGNPALMTVDRDATVRLWVKVPPTKGDTTQTKSGRLSSGVASWMEEIARSPHAERTTRAGAAFVQWGGGGGCAEDEVDAYATGAASEFIVSNVAPKPSRCVHWIVRVAAGNAQAWHVRGLDDRPRAEYARLEPGSGDALHGAESEQLNFESDSRPSLRDVAVIATRCVAPIPLTTSSQRKAGLVRSYAISNGERLLRSPEPPNPPNIAAVFVLLVRNGNPVLSRYDVSPTSNAPAVCRARVGAGHSTPIVSLVTSQETRSLSETRGLLASLGCGGDVMIWRTDVSAGAREPISIAARLAAPHTAVAFAPLALASSSRGVFGLFAVDAAFGTLRLFALSIQHGWRNRNAIQNMETAEMVSTCFDSRATDRTVKELFALPLPTTYVHHEAESGCVVFGISSTGQVRTWHAYRISQSGVEITYAKLSINGRRMGHATAAGTCVEGGTGDGLLAVGGDDGCMRVYKIAKKCKPTDAMHNGRNRNKYGAKDGQVYLDEVAFLGERDGSEASVCEIDISAGGTRIVSTRDDGSIVVWERSSAAGAGWFIELSYSGSPKDKMPVTRRSSLLNIAEKTNGLNGSQSESSDCWSIGVSTGHDRDGDLCLITSHPSGVFEVFQKPLGTEWERSGSFRNVASDLSITKSAIVHIGPGFVAASSGCGISIYTANFSGKRSMTFGADAAGYSPARGLMALLLTGGKVMQTNSALEELHSYLKVAAQKTISSSTYGAGRGLIPPPPSLKMLLSPYVAEEKIASNNNADMQAFAIQSTSGPGRSLFAELMARSEAKLRQDGDGTIPLGHSNTSKDAMSALSDLLRSVSLSGISRAEVNVLAAFARALSSLQGILPSLDPSGARFALIVSCYREALPSASIPTSIVSFAVHSSSCDALMDHFLPAPKPGSLGVQRLAKLKATTGGAQGPSMWDFARQIGAGWWVSTVSGAKRLIERIARSEFNRTRNAEHAALWYIALGRNSAVAALYKAQQDDRMSKFFIRNFSLPENRTAASKNAYVLVSKHRLLLATAFFILANNITGALSLVKTRIKDEQLYILLARVLSNGEHLESCLNTVSSITAERGDHHSLAMSLWLVGKHDQALSIVSESEPTGKTAQFMELERALGSCLPPAVFTLGHVLAMSERPPIRGIESTMRRLQICRWKAARALQGDECPIATLKVTFDLTRFLLPNSVPPSSDFQNSYRPPATDGSLGEKEVPTPIDYLNSIQAISAAADAIKGRSVAFAGAVRSGVTKRSLQTLLEVDLTELRNSFLGSDRTVEAAVAAISELSLADEVDAAVSLALSALNIAKENNSAVPVSHAELALESCLRVAVSRALFHVQCAVFMLHKPNTTSYLLRDVLSKTKSAIDVLDHAQGLINPACEQLAVELKGCALALRFGVGFLQGDWIRILISLRSCELLWPSVSGLMSQSSRELSQDFGGELDAMDKIPPCSNVSADSISVEALRHMASNPAVLGMSPGLGHRRRRRRAPSMTLIEHIGVSAATLPDESSGVPTLSTVANDQFALIRIHPALSSTLCASALAYLSTHLASRAAKIEKRLGPRAFSNGSKPPRQFDTTVNYRLVDAAEALEHVASDAIAGWTPLPAFGVEADQHSMANPDESAGAFVDLWTTLGCLPEYAPTLSEAATVAAAELAADASRAAVEAAEVRDGGRRMRRRRERKGEAVANIKKEGLAHLDTTADVMLHGAYPVRFSSSATGPWSGRGRHASLYRESGALFRKLCVSCTDPPAVIVATPKGIQEIVPSSYTTMPAGFRSHYLSQRQKKRHSAQEQRLNAEEAEKARDRRAAARAQDDEIISSFNAGFGEGPYLPLNMTRTDSPTVKPHRSSFSRNKNAIWRHQVEATALAAHPLRRRFATGGTDGFVRLWDFADPISLASLREEQYGRVAGINFSAYGNRIMAVYSSGRVTIWDDPDNYRAIDYNVPVARRRKALQIMAFDNRAASDGIFLDERHTVAIVGDPMAPPAVGDSLRVFDTREPNSAFHASWSAKVHDHGESRCIALLEDRVRIATGGVNGTLSVVDLRTKGCIAELPAHPDEVTCLAVEWPRGRALVSGCRNGDIKVWDSRTLLQLDVLHGAHTPTRHYWSGSGIGGLVGSYGTQSLALTNRSLISCGGDGVVKIWGPGWSDYDLNVL